MTTSPPPPDPRLAASVDNWKRKLLDLTKRNRALNFRMNRVSTVAVVDEQAPEVFRKLVLDGGSLRFKPAPEPESKSAAPTAAVATVPAPEPTPAEPIIPTEPEVAAPVEASVMETPAAVDAQRLADPSTPAASDALPGDAADPSPPLPHLSTTAHSASVGPHTPTPALIDDEDAFVPALAFVPYNRAGLDERHADNVLQTTSTAERLDQSLRRIDEQARSTLEEQGVNALFLALGMLHYLEAADSTEVFRAPLVLVPVELTRKSARAGYTLKATEDEPLVNPALAEYLRRMHKLALPELPLPLPEDYDLQAFLSATAAASANLNGWAVKNEIYLGLFSFQKFVMYKDLEANSPAFAAHPLIQQLTQGARAGGQFLSLPNDVRALDLDRDFAPEQTFQVVDADSSQVRALAAVGKSVV